MRRALLLLPFTLLACSANSDRGGSTPSLDSGTVQVDASLPPDGGGISFDAGNDTTLFDGKFDPDAACATGEALAIKAPVDIIMAVDQSGSMSDDIANVKANINKLSDFLKASGLDYRVVMIARPGTDTYAVCVPPPLGGPTCGDNPPTYRRSAREVQSTDALGLILKTYDSTSPLEKWADTLRPEATKAFVPITDDDAREPAPAPYWQTFDNEILKRGSGTFGTAAKRKYLFFPICGASATDPSVKCGTNAVNNGSQYVELAKLTGGKTFPLCEKDFGPVFLDMAKAIAGAVSCELTVPKPPTGETIDPERVNVTHTPSDGSGTNIIPQDASKGCEEGANGWQYNADKTKILLCGDACKNVRADPGGKVLVQFGCKTKVK